MHAIASGWHRGGSDWLCAGCAPAERHADPLVAYVSALAPRATVERSPHAGAVWAHWPTRADGLADLRALRAEGFTGGLTGFTAMVYERGSR